MSSFKILHITNVKNINKNTNKERSQNYDKQFSKFKNRRKAAEKISRGMQGRVKLIQMDDIMAPPAGTCGTVSYVDDIGSIHVNWDTGSTLAIVYGVDSCMRIREE